MSRTHLIADVRCRTATILLLNKDYEVIGEAIEFPMSGYWVGADCRNPRYSGYRQTHKPPQINDFIGIVAAKHEDIPNLAEYRRVRIKGTELAFVTGYYMP